jgi:hypothetical protein
MGDIHLLGRRREIESARRNVERAQGTYRDAFLAEAVMGW